MQNPHFDQNLTFQSAFVTLKLRSISPSFNQFLALSLQYIYESLVKIEPPAWKIVCGNNCHYRIVNLKIIILLTVKMNSCCQGDVYRVHGYLRGL